MRSCVSLWGSLLLLLLLLGTTDGYLNGRINRCQFNSTQTKDIRFISSFFFNKLEFLRFDSDVGRFQGFTAFGVEVAQNWNKDQALLNQSKAEKYRYCVPNVNQTYHNIISKTVIPYAVLNTAPSSGSERVLVCSVYGFFPKDISVTWTNHSQPITNGIITTTGPMANSDWYYQLHTHLEYTPRSGDQISCVIKHVSLDKPMVLNYGWTLSDVDLMVILIGAAGLALGLIVSLIGFLCYKYLKQDQA